VKKKAKHKKQVKKMTESIEDASKKANFIR
jgi:hypothetical protein